MTKAMKRYWRGAMLAAMLAFSTPAMTQDFPSRAITIIVPYAPGVGLDRIARGLTEPLQEQLGVPVIVENRPGAGSIVGANYVRTSALDGYTILFNGQAFVAGVLLQQEPVFDPIADFTPIVKVAGIPAVVVASNVSGFETIDDMIAFARSHPGQLSFASAGVAVVGHLTMERLARIYDIDLPVIQYQDAGQAMMDMVSGRVPLYAPSFPAAQPHLDSGSFRAIAFGARERTPLMPDLPTIGEVVGDPDFEGVSPFVFFGPAGMDPVVTERLSTAIATAIETPDVQELLANLGALVDVKHGEELELEIERTYDVTHGLLQDLGLIGSEG